MLKRRANNNLLIFIDISNRFLPYLMLRGKNFALNILSYNFTETIINADKAIPEIWLFCANFEKLTSINEEFLKVKAQQPNFHEWLCLHSFSPQENFS